MLEPLERAAEHARRTGDHARVLAIRLRAFTAHYYGPTPASDAIATGRALMDDVRDHPAIRVRTGAILGACLGFRGEFDEGWRLLDEAWAGAETIGDTGWISLMGFQSTPLGLASGQYERGERDVRRSLAVLEGTGDRGWTATLSAQLAMLLFEQGRV